MSLPFDKRIAMSCLSRPRSVDAVVVLPARDENDEIVDCLRHLQAAASAALDTGAAASVQIVVVAHKCIDYTAKMAAAVMSRSDLVVVDEVSATVGGARARGVAAANVERRRKAQTWIFNTDADSRVPAEWISASLHYAQARLLHVVAGLTELRPSDLSSAVLDRYDSVVRARWRSADDHDHVYGANLAVRLDAYGEVGGFADLESGEDVDLVRRIRAAGYNVGTPTTPAVLTSARTKGRAPLGVADLLLELRKEAV